MGGEHGRQDIDLGSERADYLATAERDEPPPDPYDTAPGAGDEDHSYAQYVEREVRRLRARRDAEAILRAEDAATVEWPQAVPLPVLLAEPDEQVKYRVDGLWPRRGRVLIAAQRKAGKTTLRDNLARSLVDGTPFLDRFHVDPVTDGTVVILDTEMSRDLLRRWLRTQHPDHPERIVVVPLRGRVAAFDLLDATTRSRWAKLLAEYQAQVVILDCLRPVLDVLGLDESHDAGTLLAGFDALLDEADADEGAIVHHMGHGGERSRGDSRLRDWPDAEWRLLYDKTDDGDDPDHIETARYFAAAGRDCYQAESRLRFDFTTGRVSLVGGSRQEEKIADAVAEVVQYVADNPGITANGIERGLAGDHPMHVVRQARSSAEFMGYIRVERGPRNSRQHFLGPREWPTTSTASPPRRRGESECVSASIDDALTRSTQPEGTATQSDDADADGDQAHAAEQLLADSLGAQPLDPDEGDQP